MKKRLHILVLLGIVGAALAGCRKEGVVEKLEIHLSEYAFTPSEITFPVEAEVHLILVNDGSLEHELFIGRDANDGYEVDLFDRDPGKVQASGSEGFHVGSDEEIAEEGYHVELEPGASGEIVFTVPADKVGEWEMGCFLDEGAHYDQGMVGKVTITPP